MTIIISITILLFNKIKLFESSQEEKILTVVVPENLDYTNMFDETFTKFTKKAVLEKAKTTNMGSLFELKYRLTLLKDINEKDFIDEIREKNGNLKVMLSHEVKSEEM